MGWRFPKVAAERLELRGYNLRLALQELGPTFIKIGQFLSTRPDIIPAPIIDQLQKLLDEIESFPTEKAVNVIESELKAPLSSIYKEFSMKPAASASLAQVHEAVTTEGDSVVVKVQRPDIEKIVSQDIQIIYGITGFLKKRTELAKSYDLEGIAKDFDTQINEELDFLMEATNIELLADNLRDFDYIKLPCVYRKYSTGKVLTLEKIEGFKVTDKEKLDSLSKETRQVLADQLLQAYLKQILEDGFFHGDPHPGNIFVLPEGRLVLLDLGITGKFDRETRSYVTKLLLSLVEQETVQITDIVLRMSTRESHVELGKLRQDISRLVVKYYNRPAKDINIGQAVIELMQIVMRYNLLLPSSLGMLAKTLLYIDMISRFLDPEINYIHFVNKHSQRLLYERIRTQFAAPRIIRNLLDVNEFMFDLPPKAHALLQKASEDNLNIKFQHVGLEGLEQTLDSVANRMSFALIVAALIVGSALVMLIPVGPYLYGYPALGIFGFAFASILGLYLIYTIIRSRGKM